MTNEPWQLPMETCLAVRAQSAIVMSNPAVWWLDMRVNIAANNRLNVSGGPRPT